MYPKACAAASVAVARLGIGFISTWSVSAIRTYSSVMRARSAGFLKNSMTLCGRLRTPKWPYLASTSVVSCGTKTVGMNFSTPSGSPRGDGQSRVKLDISVHGPSISRCLSQWWYMMRACHWLYTEPCAVSSVWNGRRFGGHLTICDGRSTPPGCLATSTGAAAASITIDAAELLADCVSASFTVGGSTNEARGCGTGTSTWKKFAQMLHHAYNKAK